MIKHVASSENKPWHAMGKWVILHSVVPLLCLYFPNSQRSSYAGKLFQTVLAHQHTTALFPDNN